MEKIKGIVLKIGCLLLLSFYQYGNPVKAISASQKQASDTLVIRHSLEIFDSLLASSKDEDDVADKLEKLYESLSDSTGQFFFIERLGEKGIKRRKEYHFDHAFFWHHQQKKFADLAHYPVGAVVALNNIGLLNRRMDRYAKSIEAYQLALRISDSLGYVKGMTHATNGLGNIYLLLGNSDEALRNFRECLRLEQSLNNLTGIALNLNNIGHVYLQQNNPQEALEYFMLSLEVNRELNNKRGIAICYNDIGEIYQRQGDNEKAMHYFMMSHQINTDINDLYYLSWNKLKIAEILLLSKNDLEALPYVTQSQELAEKTNNRSVLKDAYTYLYQINKALGRTQQALDFLEKATVLNDSILNENTQKIVYRMQATFNREQADHKIALLENEKQLADLKMKRQKMLTMFILGVMFAIILGMIAVLLFLYYLRKKNNELKTSYLEIETARNQLREYADQLLVAKQEAEKGNLLKSQFLANMSHEIRTPMNSVIGFADILSKMIDNPEQLNYLASIRVSGHSLLALINDILDLSKIEAGKANIVQAPMDYFALLEDVRKVFDLQCIQQKNELIIETGASVPRFFQFGESALRQVLFNLVGNAMKFTNSGKITLSTSISDVFENTATLLIQVADTGSGISEQDLEFIFEAFYQTHSGQTENRGTGLGLTITKRLVEALGGSISVQSKAGQGTTFYLSFPRVALIPGLHRLKLISHDTEFFHHAEVCLLSNQNLIKAFVDKALENTHCECDVYPDFQLIRENDSQNFYRLYLLDLDLAAMPEKSGGMNDEIILWLTSRNAPVATLGTTDDQRFVHEVWPHFILPDQIDQLSTHIRFSAEYLPNRDVDNKVPQFVFPHDMAASGLIRTFLQAERSHFFDDITEFANQLGQYAKAASKPQLDEFDSIIRRAVDAFDIEGIEQCFRKFRQQTNVDEFQIDE